MDMFLASVMDYLEPVIAGLVAMLIVAAMRWLIAEFKARVSERHQAFVQHVVAAAVLAAEQYGINAEVDDKKTWAINYIQAQLDIAGIPLDAGRLEALVEAEVFAQFRE